MTPRRLDPATIGEKLQLLRELVEALAQLDPLDSERLRSDVIARLAVERALTQGVELVVATCSHVVGASGTVTRTYREAIGQAGALGLIDVALAGSLSGAVGMRNLLVHEYARIDVALVAAAVPGARRDFTAFVQQVSRWTAAQG